MGSLSGQPVALVNRYLAVDRQGTPLGVGSQGRDSDKEQACPYHAIMSQLATRIEMKTDEKMPRKEIVPDLINLRGYCAVPPAERRGNGGGPAGRYGVDEGQYKGTGWQYWAS